MDDEIKDLVGYKMPEVPTPKDNLWRRILKGDFPDGNAYGTRKGNL